MSRNDHNGRHYDRIAFTEAVTEAEEPQEARGRQAVEMKASRPKTAARRTARNKDPAPGVGPRGLSRALHRRTRGVDEHGASTNTGLSRAPSSRGGAPARRGSYLMP